MLLNQNDEKEINENIQENEEQKEGMNNNHCSDSCDCTQEINYEELCEKLQKELEYNKKLAAADMQNAFREQEKRRIDSLKYAAQKVVEDLVPLFFSFDMAIKYSTSQADTQGIKMLKEQFLKLLEKHNVQEINPKAGEKFDPNKHESVGYEESEKLDKDSISKVEQVGYKINERIIVAAKVLLAKGN